MIDLNGITLTSNTNALSVANNSYTWSWNANGHMKPSNQPAIQISSNAGVWVYISGWTTVALTGGETVNRSSMHSGNRLYATQTGTYIMTASSYALCDSALVRDYFHPLFSVNGNYGAVSGRGGTYGTAYRIRHYGITSGGYCDLQISEIKRLQVGDWVEFVTYSNSSTNRYYTGYTMFGMAMIG